MRERSGSHDSDGNSHGDLPTPLRGPSAGNCHGAEPTSNPALLPATSPLNTPPVAGHPTPGFRIIHFDYQKDGTEKSRNQYLHSGLYWYRIFLRDTEAKGRAGSTTNTSSPYAGDITSHTADIYCAKTYFTSFPHVLQEGNYRIGVCVASAV